MSFESMPPAERWTEFDEEAQKEIARFRERFVAARKAEAQKMLDRKLIREPKYKEMLRQADRYERRPDSEVVATMLNNFWGHLPGGMYRAEGEFGGGEDKNAPLHEALDKAIEDQGCADIVARIVKQDSSLDATEKQMTLFRLFMALRSKGFSADELGA